MTTKFLLQKHSCLLILAATLVYSAVFVPHAAGAEACAEWVATIVSVQGNVQMLRSGEEEWQPVRFNNTFCQGDMLRVQELSRAAIVLNNDAVIRLDQKTIIIFGPVEKKQGFLLKLLKGVAHIFSSKPRSLEVVTPFVNAGVEGTEFLIRVDKKQAVVTVFEGRVRASNQGGSVTIDSGQSATVDQPDQLPTVHVALHPRDAVRWTLHYPPVLWYSTDDFPDEGQSAWQARVRKSLQMFREGKTDAAFRVIEQDVETIRDARFFNYRASVLLSVGRVSEAQSDIQRSLQLAPNNSDALAIQSIIAVTQNMKDRALSLALQAVESGPKEVAPLLALSYARQAGFELEAALQSLQEAVELVPENGLAWARLAELQLMFERLDKAFAAAHRAAELSPDLSRPQTVLGFCYLAQIKIQQAQEAFDKAIDLDQAAPLPRLGLGLAKIRAGDLKSGRMEIVIVASLDPNNSLIRSYLGKAYYEEKRDKKAADQFAIAEELDPLDPTPLFYDAIRKQSINRPVEALHDLQESIALNDNRAVYRSRLLLDEDLAARSASLARIYNNLGFQQLALVEGWRSVNAAPDNFSAHRFLADSYSALPRHEIARVSELLQSQLLQPININPVQPQLAESRLFILNGAGPGNLSFNEFNSLFNRNGVATQWNGITGDNDTRGDEIVLSGVYQNFSMSTGQFHYETNGFRENNDQTQDIYNVFVQTNLSHKTSVQAEFRYKETENGDLSLRFFPDDFISGLRQNADIRSARLGIHQIFSPGSDLIGSFIIEKADIEGHLTDQVPGMDINFDTESDVSTYLAEIQYLFRNDLLNAVFGGGYVKTNIDDSLKTAFIFVPPIMPPIETIDETDNDIHHSNLYVYGQIKYPENFIFTVGGSADFLKDREEDFRDNNQFNPKLGVIWNPVPETTLRAAYFKVLGRTLTTTNQTIEPTQVAGFNQFFDDIGGTSAENYGIAIDQKFSTNLYGGVEYSHRDLKVPSTIIIPPSTVDYVKKDWEDRQDRAYLYWTPHPWFALMAEYLYERHEEKDDELELLKTHRYPLGINFFHPSGLTAQMRATYFDQEGKFKRQGSLDLPAEAGADNFWIVDASVSYRLPKRLGIISVVGKNVFSQSFKFRDLDPVNPVIQPGSSFFIKFTISI